MKSKFVCTSCGYDSTKWYGRCPECGNWNTFEAVAVVPKRGAVAGHEFLTSKSAPKKLIEVKSTQKERFSTGLSEFDRVLGGSESTTGIVPGAVMLLSGDPGIGKSTVLLQVAMLLSSKGKSVLYVSGEESLEQIKMRAERLGGYTDKKTERLTVFATTNIDDAASVIEKGKPGLVVIDSIQTLGSLELPGLPGSVPQVRNATAKIVSLAKQHGIPVFLVGHVTKEGMVAGPQLLSHMVDTVLYLEGDAITGTRILRAFKNRFGDTSEVGIFIMQEVGLLEISDMAEFFIGKNPNTQGACLTVVMEGSRPLLVEIQALVVPSSLTYPRRVTNGIQDRRLELLLAVIQKHIRVPLERMDVFVNVVGGLKITEPASDLAVVIAVLSSYKGRAPSYQVAIAEVGLLGELKRVVQLEKRVKEAKKFGFRNVATADTIGSVQDLMKGNSHA